MAIIKEEELTPYEKRQRDNELKKEEKEKAEALANESTKE